MRHRREPLFVHRPRPVFLAAVRRRQACILLGQVRLSLLLVARARSLKRSLLQSVMESPVNSGPRKHASSVETKSTASCFVRPAAIAGTSTASSTCSALPLRTSRCSHPAAAKSHSRSMISSHISARSYPPSLRRNPSNSAPQIASTVIDQHALFSSDRLLPRPLFISAESATRRPAGSANKRHIRPSYALRTTHQFWHSRRRLAGNAAPAAERS